MPRRHATARHDPSQAPRGLPWIVTRLELVSGGRLVPGGADDFRTLADARRFVTENPGVWGR